MDRKFLDLIGRCSGNAWTRQRRNVLAAREQHALSIGRIDESGKNTNNCESDS